ncbi:MAG: MgtC/SapB family protein [Rhodothermales bacterium]|nr:MgtC/SapB family protein [Rhodothermales bacterium]
MTMEPFYDVSIKLVTALAIGLLFGIERGWSDRAEEDGDRIAGLRTFTLMGILGGVLALIAQSTSDWILAAAFVAVAGIIITFYVVDTRVDDDVGATTEVALLLTFALAVWSAYGYGLAALATTVVSIALLGYKPTLHGMLHGIDRVELFAGIKLLVISVVLLPLLPNQGYGPWEALNPYWIWWMVVLISGLSFLGYMAIKVFGERLGALVTAIAGSLASSTAVTISLARFARGGGMRGVYFGGALIAGTIMFIRVMIEVSIVNPVLLNDLWLPVGITVGIMVVSAGLFWFIGGDAADASVDSLDVSSPLKLGMAVKFGLLLAVILMLSNGMKEWLGDGGIYMVAVASGLMDVDAIVLSLSRMAMSDLAPEVAVLGIVLASVTNTLVKGAIFAWITGFRRSLRLILALIAAVVPGLVVAIIML